MNTSGNTVLITGGRSGIGFEIRPGQSNQLKLMNRIAPQFILNQLSKSVDSMLAN